LLTLKALRDNWIATSVRQSWEEFGMGFFARPGESTPPLGVHAPAGAGTGPGTESTDSSRPNAPGATPWLPPINGDDAILR
jgi:hypothetical protein